MDTSPKFRDVISALACKHGLDLTAPEAHLKISNEPYMDLYIEKIGPYLLSVAHFRHELCYEIPDPQVILHTLHPEWVPIEIHQVLGTRQAAWLDDTGTRIVGFQPTAQGSIAIFSEWWADNLRDQDWLEYSIIA
jgi:hypothetical protein